MKLLLDTHLVLWSALGDPRLPSAAADLLRDPSQELYLSAACIWEVAIKSSRGDPDFRVNATDLRRNFLANGYLDLPITSAHATAIRNLPPIHKDPFDRILIAQAMVERITLLTTDRKIAKYPGPIRKV